MPEKEVQNPAWNWNLVTVPDAGMAADGVTTSKPPRIPEPATGVPVCPTVVSASAEPTGTAANTRPTNNNTRRTRAKTTILVTSPSLGACGTSAAPP
jgi:hypothetical protein